MANNIDAKKEVANEVLNALSPNVSAQLGGNLGYGVNTLAGDMIPQASESIRIWVRENESAKLIATIMTANALGAITDEEADLLIDKIKKIDKR